MHVLASLALSTMLLTQHKAAAQFCHAVLSGDTLWLNAVDNGTTWQNLQAINNIPNPNLIYPGQLVCFSGEHTPYSFIGRPRRL